MLPAASHNPESEPFLLVRACTRDVTEVTEEDEREVSGARSVPPRPPPSAVQTTENDLPSVIVDLRELELSAEEEAQRDSDLDVLLAATEIPSGPPPLVVPLCGPDLGAYEDMRRQPTLPTIERERGAMRSLALGLLVLALGGGALGMVRFAHLVLPLVH